MGGTGGGGESVRLCLLILGGSAGGGGVGQGDDMDIVAGNSDDFIKDIDFCRTLIANGKDSLLATVISRLSTFIVLCLKLFN